jgi:hypothetical protein
MLQHNLKCPAMMYHILHYSLPVRTGSEASSRISFASLAAWQYSLAVSHLSHRLGVGVSAEKAASGEMDDSEAPSRRTSATRGDKFEFVASGCSFQVTGYRESTGHVLH